MQVIPCSKGEIYPWGHDALIFETPHKRIAARILREIEGTELFQDGDDIQGIRFPVDRFEEIAAIVKPYRRPALSPSERSMRRDHMQRYWQYREAAADG